jgi:hypothetical protein
MWLPTWLRRSISTNQLLSWAVDVARQCHDAVSARLSPAIFEMSLSEARGYVRARSAAVLDEEIARLQKRTGCQASLLAIVRDRGSDELIRMTMGDLLKAMRQPQQVRKAA